MVLGVETWGFLSWAGREMSSIRTPFPISTVGGLAAALMSDDHSLQHVKYGGTTKTNHAEEKRHDKSGLVPLYRKSSIRQVMVMTIIPTRESNSQYQTNHLKEPQGSKRTRYLVSSPWKGECEE